MKSIFKLRPAIVVMRLLALMAILTSFASMSGCGIADDLVAKFADKYKIENYYVDDNSIHKVSRVIVAQFSNATGCSRAPDDVMPVFIQELRKARKFDVILAQGRELSVISEKYANGSYDIGDYISNLCRDYGADGVLVGEIKEYQPYKPFVLGLKFSIFIPDKNGAVWSVDETLDASMKDVSASAEYYYTRNVEKDVFNSGSDIMSDSPKRFAQFVCYSLISTIDEPERKR